jgi:glycosyltransferase involved in cell wall biosynthesis
MVSIVVITYNHEKYIAEAIESILMQATSFLFELIIANDASTDSTNAIIEDFMKKHSRGNLIRYIHHEKNVGMIPNFISALEQSTGKYIAMCEGDDYWTDASKLQKQVDFLEANIDYTICFHRVYELVEGQEPELSKLNTSLTEETYTVEDLAKGNFIHTPSVVFRNRLIKEFPRWLIDSPVADYPLHMLNAAHGKIKYFPEPLAVYRRHSAGVWGKKSQLHQSTGWIWMLEHLANEFTSSEIVKLLLMQKAENEFYIASYHKNDGNEMAYFKWLHQACCSSYIFFV